MQDFDEEKPSTGKSHKKKKKRARHTLSFTSISHTLPYHKILREILHILEPYEEKEFAGKANLIQKFNWLCIPIHIGATDELARFPIETTLYEFHRAVQKVPDLRNNKEIQELIQELVEK